jgi:5'-deoxynucleotidase YfbR-like HD superfamily hydrolase
MRTSKTWIQTWGGRQFWPMDARPEEVFIDDIAWMLAQQNRWKGATMTPISIAQHSVIVSRLCHPDYALQGLLHDATEAYLGDMASPVKSQIPEFQLAEARLWRVIATRFGVPVDLDASVKLADAVSLHTESRDLMRPPPVEWRSKLPTPMEERIVPWSAQVSATAFLERFAELYRGDA